MYMYIQGNGTVERNGAVGEKGRMRGEQARAGRQIGNCFEHILARNTNRAAGAYGACGCNAP